MYNWIAHEDHLVQDKKDKGWCSNMQDHSVFPSFHCPPGGLFGSLLPSQNLQGTTHQNHVASLT